MEFFWSVWLFIKISFWFSWHQVVKDVIPEPPQKMISVIIIFLKLISLVNSYSIDLSFRSLGKIYMQT